MAAEPDQVEGLVASLREGRKYRHLCDDILRWAATTALERQPTQRAALKFAKRKLHQAFGSFVGDRRRLLASLDRAAHAADDVSFQSALDDALRCHASTAERAPDFGALWSCVRDAVGPVPSVLDLGCGAAPGTLPWSGLSSDVRYLGVDLDDELCRALEAALRPRYPRLAVTPGDVRTAEQWPHFDVAILAKLLPTLERQAAGSASQLVARLDVDVIVATFPVRSLSGRDHGMAESYVQLADAVLGPGRTVTLPGELVRIVRRRAC